jgi:hypothetical protein
MARPDSIREIGLEPYLDRTIDEHNGFGYGAFATCMNAELSYSSMCRLFNVSRGTLAKLISIYREEQLAKRAA